MKNINWKKLILAVAIPLAVGALSSLISGDSRQIYQQLNKPLLYPPGWLFPVAWTIIYILMGIASYIVFVSEADGARKKRALTFYAIQLLLNFLWPLVFFGLGMPLAAFFLLLILSGFVFATQLLFEHIDINAGRLLVPYLLWLAFAAYLNLGIVFLN